MADWWDVFPFVLRTIARSRYRYRREISRIFSSTARTRPAGSELLVARGRYSFSEEEGVGQGPHSPSVALPDHPISRALKRGKKEKKVHGIDKYSNNRCSYICNKPSMLPAGAWDRLEMPWRRRRGAGLTSLSWTFLSCAFVLLLSCMLHMAPMGVVGSLHAAMQATVDAVPSLNRLCRRLGLLIEMSHNSFWEYRAAHFAQATELYVGVRVLPRCTFALLSLTAPALLAHSGVNTSSFATWVRWLTVPYVELFLVLLRYRATHPYVCFLSGWLALTRTSLEIDRTCFHFSDAAAQLARGDRGRRIDARFGSWAPLAKVLISGCCVPPRVLPSPPLTHDTPTYTPCTHSWSSCLPRLSPSASGTQCASSPRSTRSR